MARNRYGSDAGVTARQNRKYFTQQAQAQTGLSTRIDNLEASEKHLIRMVQLSSLFLDGVTLTSGVDYTPPVSPATAIGVDNIQGIIGTFWISTPAANRQIYFGSSDDTLTSSSQQYRFQGGTDTNRHPVTQLVMIAVGTDGNIKMQAAGGNVTASMAICGYWI